MPEGESKTDSGHAAKRAGELQRCALPGRRCHTIDHVLHGILRLYAGTPAAALKGAEIRSGSRCALVFVYKPAQPVAPFHSHRLRARPTLERCSTIRRRELQGPMRSMDVVMIDENRQGALEMLGTYNQQPVQALGPSGPDEPFRNSVRLRKVDRCPYDSDALRLEHGIEAVREFAIVIANQKTKRLWSVAERPRDLPRLLRDPLGAGMSGAPGQVDAATGDFNEEQHVQSAAARRYRR